MTDTDSTRNIVEQNRDRIGDILDLVRETRTDVATIKKSLYGNGSGIGLTEGLRIVTAILDKHIDDHAIKAATVRAVRNGAFNRVLNIAERTIPWGLLVGFVFSR